MASELPTVVVSNAGPLMALAKLNLLHLLPALYEQVYFTQSVYDETVSEGLRYGYEDARTLQLFLLQSQWQPEPIDLTTAPESLQNALLDKGERDTLILALAEQAQLILMDEEAGRQLARDYGLTVRGTLGILVEAYYRHVINATQLRFYLAEIAQRSDIWISPALCQHILDETLKD